MTSVVVFVSIRENLEGIRERIAAAARRCGRSPDEIALMAVSKTFPASAIGEAYEAGQRLFGENRVQEFAEKAEQVKAFAGAQFHLIGHLQSNKAGKAAELFDAVDSVDSPRLVEKLNDVAAKIGKKLPILIEVNVGGEEQKSGMAPGSPELEELLQAAARLEAIEIRGLMTVPPFTEDPQGARPYFRALRELRDRIAARKLPRVRMDVLSMGMSHDFEVAIEEGSTSVRIGTAIFGSRPRP